MGAGTISIEFKTLYAYDSILFDIVADARSGIHAQIDIRKYFIKGGHRAIDNSLIKRVHNILNKSIEIQQSNFFIFESPSIQRLSSVSTGDFIVNFLSTNHHGGESLYHVLGPSQTNQSSICKAMIFAKIRSILGAEGNSFHCDICTPYVV
jgi:hypothetical protein